MKVVVTGIECSGKSTLSESLSNHYGVPYLSEYSRWYLNEYGSDYTESDLLKIAQGQRESEYERERLAQAPIICDTSLLVIMIWSLIRFGHCHHWILEQIELQTWDLFILCDHDIPLEPDPLRDFDLDRESFYQQYLSELSELNVPYHLVHGSSDQRLRRSVEIIDGVLNS